MRLFAAAAVVCGLLLPSSVVCAESDLSSTRVQLPNDFTPPQVFKNLNLLRNTNLEKGYVRETVDVVVENVDDKPQREYYLPFPADVFGKIGGLEVRDKKSPEKGRFDAEAIETDSSNDINYYVVQFPDALAPSSQITLRISYSVLSSLSPLPATIHQSEQQYLAYTFSAYALSAYPVDNQKTKLKLPSVNVPDYTTTTGLKSGQDPERQGSVYTYGPYETAKVAPGTQYPVTVRYEFTKPVLTAHLLERDIEVSHWGGNLATEERYWLRNNGSQLEKQFSRLEWTVSTYQGFPTSALRELTFPLKPGSVDPYFTDDIGNVSTSRFRPGKVPNRDGSLELRPRFPIFGGWNYSFRIGWNNDLSLFLRKAIGSSGTYILKVPFIEGPKNPEGIQYEKVVVRVILPEGARNVQWETINGATSNGLPSLSQIHSELNDHKTFMDTLGRTALTLTIENLSDEARSSELLISYDYTLWDGLRKPVTITAGLFTVFVALWFVGSLDVSIKKR